MLRKRLDRQNERIANEEKQKDVSQKVAALGAIAVVMTMATGYSMNKTMEIEQNPHSATSSEEDNSEKPTTPAFPEYAVPVEDPENLNPPTERVEIPASDYVVTPNEEPPHEPQASYPPEPFQ